MKHRMSSKQANRESARHPAEVANRPAENSESAIESVDAKDRVPANIQMNGVNGRKGPTTEETALERHYTVQEVSEMWHLDEKMIRRIFGDEPGVVDIGSNESRFRRAYRTLRIPESVLVRVHRRLRRAG